MNALAKQQPLPFEDHAVHAAVIFAVGNDGYFSAVARCPHVVQAESPHDLFLRFEEYNVWKAAQRLANYWTLRVQVYGEEAAFLPLALALNCEDIENLKEATPRGITTLLHPKKDGTSCLFWDRAALFKNDETGHTASSRKRCNFLIHQIVMITTTVAARQGDFVRISLLDSTRILWTTRLDKSMAAFAKLRLQAMCTRATQVHQIYIGPQRSGRAMLSRMLLNVMLHAAPVFASLPLSFHAGSPSQVMESLQRFGFQESGIPESCGGTWSSSENSFLEDLLYRRRELQRYGLSSAVPGSSVVVAPTALDPPVAPVAYSRGGCPLDLSGLTSSRPATLDALETNKLFATGTGLPLASIDPPLQRGAALSQHQSRTSPLFHVDGSDPLYDASLSSASDAEVLDDPPPDDEILDRHTCFREPSEESGQDQAMAPLLSGIVDAPPEDALTTIAFPDDEWESNALNYDDAYEVHRLARSTEETTLLSAAPQLSFEPREGRWWNFRRNAAANSSAHTEEAGATMLDERSCQQIEDNWPSAESPNTNGDTLFHFCDTEPAARSCSSSAERLGIAAAMGDTFAAHASTAARRRDGASSSNVGPAWLDDAGIDAKVASILEARKLQRRRKCQVWLSIRRNAKQKSRPSRRAQFKPTSTKRMGIKKCNQLNNEGFTT